MVTATSVGHDLARGTSLYTKVAADEDRPTGTTRGARSRRPTPRPGWRGPGDPEPATADVGTEGEGDGEVEAA